MAAKGDRILLDRGDGTIAPAGGASHQVGKRWRLASITEPVTAAPLARLHPDARDRPIGPVPFPRKAMSPALTLRQAPPHQSGSAEPDDSPAATGGMRGFDPGPFPGNGYCGSQPPRPRPASRCDDRDHIVAAVPTPPGPRRTGGMALAQEDKTGIAGFAGGKAEPAFQMMSRDAAGGLLAACAAPERIVPRDGEIHGVPARDCALPDDDRVVVVFANRSADDLPIGGAREGEGFARDLPSAAAWP